MKPETTGDNLVPADLLPQIRAAAAEEHRTPSDLVGEAIRRYLSERHWFGREDVHAKIVKGLESLREGKGLDGETVMAEMLAALDAAERGR
jgi:predicted transcriptional regulator